MNREKDIMVRDQWESDRDDYIKEIRSRLSDDFYGLSINSRDIEKIQDHMSGTLHLFNILIEHLGVER